MEILLQREPSTRQSTPGKLYLDLGEKNFECFTLEDVVRAKKNPSFTAIPAGRYQVKVRPSPRRRGRLVPWLLNVPNFTAVQIHSGNTAADTEGCILVGDIRKNRDRILESRRAFARLLPKIQAEREVFITIRDAQQAGGKK